MPLNRKRNLKERRIRARNRLVSLLNNQKHIPKRFKNNPKEFTKKARAGWEKEVKDQIVVLNEKIGDIYD